MLDITSCAIEELLLKEGEEFIQTEASLSMKDLKIAASMPDDGAPDLRQQPNKNDIICGRDKLAHK